LNINALQSASSVLICMFRLAVRSDTRWVSSSGTHSRI